MNVLFERKGGLGLITLNRPKVLNALTLDMYRAMAPRLADWDADPSVNAVVIRGEGRAFCAGGDIRMMYDAREVPVASPGDYKTTLFWEEYLFIRALHRLSKPWIALAHGVTMGGGAGLSVNGRYRVCTESTVFAMPEVFIGSIPDVGATRFLGLCPGKVGLHLAMTGGRLKAADAMACGLFTHFVPEGRFGELLEALAAEKHAETVLARFATDPGPATLDREAIDRCYGAPTVEDIAQAVAKEDADWAREAKAALDRASPTSLRLVKAILDRAEGAVIEDALALEYRVIQHILRQGDFYEGIRSVVIDKDKKPRWRFPRLSDVSDAEVERHFTSLGAGELRFD